MSVHRSSALELGIKGFFHFSPSSVGGDTDRKSRSREEQEEEEEEEEEEVLCFQRSPHGKSRA